jgi:hypothetical protein
LTPDRVRSGTGAENEVGQERKLSLANSLPEQYAEESLISLLCIGNKRVVAHRLNENLFIIAIPNVDVGVAVVPEIMVLENLRQSRLRASCI